MIKVVIFSAILTNYQEAAGLNCVEGVVGQMVGSLPISERELITSCVPLRKHNTSIAS